MPTEKKNITLVSIFGFFFFARYTLNIDLFRYITVHSSTIYLVHNSVRVCSHSLLWHMQKASQKYIFGFSPFLKKKLFNSNAVTKVHVNIRFFIDNVFTCTCITGRSLPYRTHTGPTLKLFPCLTQPHETFNQPLSVKTLI